VTVAGALSDVLRPIIGSDVVQAGTPLLSLNVSFPDF
jgi:hypothetical protein